jgi:hypothetical protein
VHSAQYRYSISAATWAEDLIGTELELEQVDDRTVPLHHPDPSPSLWNHVSKFSMHISASTFSFSLIQAERYLPIASAELCASGPPPPKTRLSSNSPLDTGRIDGAV